MPQKDEANIIIKSCGYYKVLALLSEAKTF